MELPARRGVTPGRWRPYNAPKHGAGVMRLPARFLIAAFLATSIGPPAGHAQTAGDFEQTVSRHVQELLHDNDTGGVAVALRANGKTSFYNYGMADAARRRPIASDSIFNLASVGKLFATTLLADAVKRGEMRLDDPGRQIRDRVAKGRRHPGCHARPNRQPHLGSAA
jgi:CubicO group peptidase (beta-lactamase class C family)